MRAAGEEFGRRCDLVLAVEMHLERRRRRWIVEMDIEDQLLFGIREPLAEFARDSSVAGTYVRLQHLAYDLLHVLDLRQLGRAPVVQEFGALEHVVSVRAGRSRVSDIVEGAAVKPEAIESATQAISLGSREEAAVFEVGLPFFAWVEGFPLLGGGTN